MEKFRSFEMYAGQVSSYQEFVSELSVKLSTQSFSQIDLPPGRRLEIYPRGLDSTWFQLGDEGRLLDAHGTALSGQCAHLPLGRRSHAVQDKNHTETNLSRDHGKKLPAEVPSATAHSALDKALNTALNAAGGRPGGFSHSLERLRNDLGPGRFSRACGDRPKTRTLRLTRALQFNRGSVAGLLEAGTSVQPLMPLITGIAFSAISVNLSTKYLVISPSLSLHS